MAIIVIIKKDFDLQSEIQKLINDNVIRTWMIDSEGDITSTAEQWYCHSWFRIVERLNNENNSQIIRIGIVPSKKFQMTKALYAIYHARFAEMLLTHFDEQICNLSITPLLEKDVDIFPVQQ